MNYRNGRDYENLQKAIFDGAGTFGIPRLSPASITADSFVGFNYAKSCKSPGDKGVHFFVDDYQFTRLWEQPDRYLEMLKRFKCVCTPDFSTYTDFPKAIQIYNHYRKHWLGAYWQMHGIKVIPTISWSDASSFDWCFDGEPEGGIVAVSSVGTQRHAETQDLFMAGYNEMIHRLSPSVILFYGSVPAGCKGSIIPITAFQDELKKRVLDKEG